MTHHNLNLTALLGARICHDMISPIGAIGNGLELLSIAGDAGGTLTDLIEDSAANANARLRLFRIAFGPTSDQTISSAELGDVTNGYFGDGNFKITWPKGADFSRSEAQLALLLCLVLETTMSRRGQVEFLSPKRIVGKTMRNMLTHPYWTVMCGNGAWPADLAPGDVQFPLTRNALEDMGQELRAWVDGQEFGIDLAPVPDSIKTEPFRHQQLGI